MELKPNSVAEVTQLLERDVIPKLRKQQGFKDEIAFVPADGKEATAISLWEERENAAFWQPRWDGLELGRAAPPDQCLCND